MLNLLNQSKQLLPLPRCVAGALAFQETLSNFFAGVYLRLDSLVHIGDYIELESGEEGFAIEHGWRSARIRTLPKNGVIVPNARLASAIVTNYSLPEPQMSLSISGDGRRVCNAKAE